MERKMKINRTVVPVTFQKVVRKKWRKLIFQDLTPFFKHATLGCIRTTDEAIRLLKYDPPKTITVMPRVP